MAETDTAFHRKKYVSIEFEIVTLALHYLLRHASALGYRVARCA